jgi:hypothetical protein
VERPGDLSASPLKVRTSGIPDVGTGRRVVLLIVGVGVDIVVVMLAPVGDAVAEDLEGARACHIG